MRIGRKKESMADLKTAKNAGQNVALGKQKLKPGNNQHNKEETKEQQSSIFNDIIKFFSRAFSSQKEGQSTSNKNEQMQNIKQKQTKEMKQKKSRLSYFQRKNLTTVKNQKRFKSQQKQKLNQRQSLPRLDEYGLNMEKYQKIKNEKEEVFRARPRVINTPRGRSQEEKPFSRPVKYSNKVKPKTQADQKHYSLPKNKMVSFIENNEFLPKLKPKIEYFSPKTLDIISSISQTIPNRRALGVEPTHIQYKSFLLRNQTKNKNGQIQQSQDSLQCGQKSKKDLKVHKNKFTLKSRLLNNLLLIKNIEQNNLQ